MSARTQLSLEGVLVRPNCQSLLDADGECQLPSFQTNDTQNRIVRKTHDGVFNCGVVLLATVPLHSSITLYKRHGWDYANETRWCGIRERTPATEVCDDHCPVTNAYTRIQITLGPFDRLSLELRVIGCCRSHANWKAESGRS